VEHYERGYQHEREEKGIFIALLRERKKRDFR